VLDGLHKGVAQLSQLLRHKKNSGRSGKSRDSSFASDYPANLQAGLFLACSGLLRVESFDILTTFSVRERHNSSRIPCSL